MRLQYKKWWALTGADKWQFLKITEMSLKKVLSWLRSYELCGWVLGKKDHKYKSPWGALGWGRPRGRCGWFRGGQRGHSCQRPNDARPPESGQGVSLSVFPKLRGEPSSQSCFDLRTFINRILWNCATVGSITGKIAQKTKPGRDMPRMSQPLCQHPTHQNWFKMSPVALYWRKQP